MYFKKNIEFLTSQSKLTKVVLAEDMGFPYETFRTYYSKNRLDFDVLIKIAEYFTITIDDLLTKDIEKTGYTKTYKVYVNKNKKVVESKNIVNEVSSLGYPTNEKETITMEHIVGEIVSKQLQTLTCEIDIIKEILKINNILDTLK